MNRQILPQAIAVTSTAFLVLCSVSIVLSGTSALRARQDIELLKLERPTISRENLSAYEEILQSRLRIEYPAIPKDAITELPAWKEFRTSIAAYSANSKLQKAQSEEFSHRLQRHSLWVSWAMLGVILVNVVLRSFQKWQDEIPVGGRNDGTATGV